MGLLGGFKMKTLLKNSPALRLAPISSSYIATITAEIFFLPASMKMFLYVTGMRKLLSTVQGSATNYDCPEQFFLPTKNGL